MITAELRRAISAAAGLDAADPEAGDPLLRPGPVPGSYASALPFRLAAGPGSGGPGLPPQPRALDRTRGTHRPGLSHRHRHSRRPGRPRGTDRAGGPGLRRERRAARPHRPRRAAGATWPAQPDWPQARAALAAQLTARLAATAGATFFFIPNETLLPPPATPHPFPAQAGPVPRPSATPGPDEVRFALARMPPGGPAPEAAVVARHVLANPAYAVRYAHAAAAAVLRWAAALGTRPAGFRPRLLAEPGELALLDALSWLPERVAMAARRGRPDEFAGYLEELAARTIDTMNTTGFTKISEH